MEVLGFSLNIVGLGVALWQLRKVRRSADAARDAALGARRALAAATLLGLLPRFEDAVSDIRYAMRTGNTDLATRALERWHDGIPRLRAYLNRRGALTPKFETQLNRSASLAVDATGALTAGDDVAASVHEFLADSRGLLFDLADERSTLELEGGTA